MSDCLTVSRIPRETRCAWKVLGVVEPRVQHLSFPLPEPRRRWAPTNPYPRTPLTPYTDIGKVLVGIQVPPGKKPDLDRFLSELRYRFVDETDNMVYKSYLMLSTAAAAAAEEGHQE